MSDPIDPSADQLHVLLQRAYATNRRDWAREIGIPYAGDVTPPPATLDVADPEFG